MSIDGAATVKKKLATKTWAQRVKKMQKALVPPANWPYRYPPRNLVERALKQLFADIAEESLHGGRPAIPDFGTFPRRVRAARRIRNPVTGALMDLPKVTSVGFRCSKSIKR